MDEAAWEASLRRRAEHRWAIERAGRTHQAMLHCADDVAYWINHFCLTYNPRLPRKVIPFDLFPRQVEFLTWLAMLDREQRRGVVEKSRDMGATWLCCAYALHCWLFRPGDKTGFGSRKLDLVDTLGDPDCIFEKIRFLLYKLPEWMLPDTFDRKANDNWKKLINPANGATVTGEGGDDIGRGGRNSRYFVDEAAALERPQRVDSALSENTNVQIDISTPNGPGNPFAAKRFSGALPVFTFHWKQDPRKNRTETLPDGRTIYPWYEAKKKELLDPVIIASQLDIDYSASVEGICIPAAWVRAAVDFDFGGWTGYARLETAAGLDIAEEGPNECAFASRRGPMVDHLSCWNGDTTETAGRAAQRAVAVGARVVAYDADGIGAGVRAAWKHWPTQLPFLVRAVHGGARASETRWPDGKWGHEKFLNLRAELWWLTRQRFERTHAFVARGERLCDWEDMISIPNDPQLIAELSLPLYQFGPGGRIKLESKVDMKGRGVKSPDRADGLVYSFAPAGPAHSYAGGGAARDLAPPGAAAPVDFRRRGGYAAG